MAFSTISSAGTLDNLAITFHVINCRCRPWKIRNGEIRNARNKNGKKSQYCESMFHGLLMRRGLADNI